MESNVGLVSKGGGAIPLVGVEVGGEVLGSHARVLLRQRYRNTEPRPVEALYTFPLSSQATLVGFKMICNGREVVGVVKEREEAFQSYDDALTQGHGAALLDEERPNVFTAQVGNLLPGEETVIEIEYLERVQADEGALRLMIPTLVAPRYIPGAAAGDRTGHGWADPTDRVPDADRITPPVSREVGYGLELDLAFDLGRPLEIESPSHAIVVEERDGKPHVRFAEPQVALDRDLVLTARGLEESTMTTLAMHQGDATYFALTVVPDLAALGKRAPRQEVVFLIDISGSMDGTSLTEARAALRLCLRHLREGDRFNVIAFDDRLELFAGAPVPFTQKTLENADRWVAALQARGGTEILQPLLEAAKQAPDGVIVLLTDGQVGNEHEVVEQLLAARSKARVYSFGIGTNVSDWMLRELGKRTSGAVELIHPGERIDEKVVAQFARAVAPRVEDLRVTFPGLEVGEQAPSSPPPLIDGEPWVIFGRIEGGKAGACRLTGQLDGKPFELEVPIDRREAGTRAVVAKLWAQERIRDLEGVTVAGRREQAMKSRIVKLALEHQVMCSHTSFLVIETRSGDRRATSQPETRVVPVHVPAGWAMFSDKQDQARQIVPAAAAPRARAFSGGPPPPPAPAPAKTAPHALGGFAKKLRGAAQEIDQRAALHRRADANADGYGKAEEREQAELARDEGGDPLTALLGRQLASGLWDDREPAAPAADEEVRRTRATARALLELLDLGVSSSHPLHGAQVKKAIEALLSIVLAVAGKDRKVAELALGVAWLVSSGRRTRRQIEDQIAKGAVTLRPWLTDETKLRAHLQQL